MFLFPLLLYTLLLLALVPHHTLGFNWPDFVTDRCPRGNIFKDDFSKGLSDDVWQLMFKLWGNGNNGVNPKLVDIVQDNVNGVNKNVIRLNGTGNLYNGTDVQGVVKGSGAYYYKETNGTRVGSGLCTRQEFSSGRYDITFKVHVQYDCKFLRCSSCSIRL